MSDQPTKEVPVGADEMDELGRRLQLAETRLGAVRTHRLGRQTESLELLTKIEERFVQQRNELLQAQDTNRRLEKLNRELVNKLRRLVSAVEVGMDAADDIFYRMVNVTNEIASFSSQTMTGDFHGIGAMDGADIDGGAGEAAADPAPVQPAQRTVAVVRQSKPEQDDGGQVLNIKQIFTKG